MDLQRVVAAPPRTPKFRESRHAWLTAGLDVSGQRDGKPVWRMLTGGPPATGPIPVNGVLPRLPTSATVREAGRLRALGYTTIKLKVGAAASEVDRVRAVRDALGPAVKLRLDPNAAWDPETALDILRGLAPLDIEYVEQPVPDGPELELLGRRSPIPIAPDESMADLEAARRWLSSGSFEVAILKPSVLGGLDAVSTLVEQAGDHGVRLVVTDRLESAVGRMAALHAACLLPAPVPACGLDGARWLRRDLVPDGTWPLGPELPRPVLPGLGITPRLAGRA